MLPTLPPGLPDPATLARMASELFAALLFALTPADELKRNYPQAKAMSTVRVLPHRWMIQYEQPHSLRSNTQGDVYSDISPLDDEASR